MRAISENLESKLPKTGSEPESSPQSENSEIEKGASSSSKSHRKSKSISQPAVNQRLSMKTAYDTVELRTPAKKETSSKDDEGKCKLEEKSSKARTKEEMKELFRSMLLKKYGFVMIFQW